MEKSPVAHFHVVLLGALFCALLPLSAWAQFETFTPTFSPTPQLAITGTPIISTVWLGVEDPLAPTINAQKAKSSAGKIKEVSGLSDEDQVSSPAPTATPQIATETGGGNGSDRQSGRGSRGKSISSLDTSKNNSRADQGEQGSGSQGPSASGGNGEFEIDTSLSGTNVKKKVPTASRKGSVYRGDSELTMLDLYHAGIESYQAKEYDQAIEYLKEALTIQDKTIPYFYYAEANAMLGVIYKFNKPDAKLARSYCENALRIDPTTRTAQKLIHEIDVNVTDTEEVYWKGIQLYGKGHYHQAIRPLQQVVETQDPTTPSFYFAEAAKTLGIIYQFYEKDLDLAEKYYGIALRIEPKDEVARHNLNKLEGSN